MEQQPVLAAINKAQQDHSRLPWCVHKPIYSLYISELCNVNYNQLKELIHQTTQNKKTNN